MKPLVKHSLIAFVCFLGAGILFAFAVNFGVTLIDMGIEANKDIAKISAKMSRASQNINEPDTFNSWKIALIISSLGASAGVGFLRGVNELFEVWKLSGKRSLKSEPYTPAKAREMP